MLNKPVCHYLWQIIVGLVLNLVMANAWCLKTDASQPIQIIADHLTVDQKNMVSTFTGNVIITQGSMNAHASLAQASQDSAGYKTIHMTGSPVTFSQLNDDGDNVHDDDGGGCEDDDDK